MDLQLTGRGAVVTGGSRGIGLAIARRLAVEGAQVVVVARARAALEDAAAQLHEQTGQPVFAVTGDASDDASVADAVAAAIQRLGTIDVLVNCAARSAGASGPATGITPAQLRAEIDVKALGYLRFAQAVVPHMSERGSGRIVNVAGLAARHTASLSAAMRNVAVAALTKTLADELGPRGIGVNGVHPGTTRTERIEARVAARAAERGVSGAQIAAEMGADYAIGRLVEPDEVAAVVAFLASPVSVAINGEVIPCGGGRVGSIHY